MRSIKYGMLAIICLLYLMCMTGDIEELVDKGEANWTPPDIVLAITILLAVGGFIIGTLLCVVIPAQED